MVPETEAMAAKHLGLWRLPTVAHVTASGEATGV